MKNIKIKLTKSLIIKAAMVLFLVIYLGQLYVSDYAADIPMEDISTALEKVDNVADLPAQGANGLRQFLSAG